MRLITFLFVCLVGLIFQPAFAVDGYKGVKFGASEAELLSQNLCTMTKGEGYVQGTSMYQCHDFKLGEAVTSAYAYFIDGKFLRFGVDLDWNGNMRSVGSGLVSKYGEASSSSTREEIRAVDTTPNASAYIAFDNDTVYINMESDERMNHSAMLIYSDLSFNSLLEKKRDAALSDDL